MSEKSEFCLQNLLTVWQSTLYTWGRVGNVGYVIILRGLKVTEQQVREALKSCGWSFLRRARRQKSYVYAARKMQGKRKEIYVCPLEKLALLTCDQLTTKLTDIVAVSL